MLDSRGVDHLTLRITEDGTELPLHEGSQSIARDAGGLHVSTDQTDAIAHLRLDRRGVWLGMGDTDGSVHVNGRRIRRTAMLRTGDAIYVNGVELVLASLRPVQLPDDALHDDSDAQARDPRIVLRGLGGQHHGRAFTLQQPRLVGSASEADIRVDDPAFAERHAQLSLVRGQVVLRDLGSAEGSLVNGQLVRDAVLAPGDQLVFDARHRFVVEAPGAVTRPLDTALLGDLAADNGSDHSRTASTWRRWPWLLLAALLIAGALAALLLFGSTR